MCHRRPMHWQHSSVHIPAQRLSAGQENGLRTGWTSQPGALGMVGSTEDETCHRMVKVEMLVAFKPFRKYSVRL
jgi:hypothetical protein